MKTAQYKINVVHCDNNIIIVIIKVGVALSYVLWAVSNNFLLFVIARIIGGLSKGNVSLSTAIVTDVTTVEKRSKGMVSNILPYMYLLVQCREIIEAHDVMKH